MSYSGISVREALEKINANNAGWYLPQIQRQYVWGARDESEDYICLLLDSLLRRYPIGGIVLWETAKKVPYRKFIEDYIPGQYAKQVDEGRWEADKFLVYDGQQRLQTLYSVLLHRFNDRILYFDLLFDKTKEEADETGFSFRDNENQPLRYLRMTRLSVLPCTEEQKVALESEVLPVANGDKEKELLIRTNLSALWSIFVDTQYKSIAYFPIKSERPREVEEVFRRLNTGGVALTQLELVLGKIKADYSDYEEKLWRLTETIQRRSDGIQFLSTAILQFFHLLIKDTIRIDGERLDHEDITKFHVVEQNDTDPLVEVFSGYLRRILGINHASIIRRWLAVLPIAAYLTICKRKGYEWQITKLSEANLRLINQYFLLSQFCDWNTPTMVTAFSREAMSAAKEGESFPLERIRAIAIDKNRTGNLNESQLLSQPLLAMKVLMPNRTYVFRENKPQMDHIFPIHLKREAQKYQVDEKYRTDEQYKQDVDILWNLQPMPAEVNNYKGARHPKKFFQSEVGKKYWQSYDFIPRPDDSLWNNHLEFIAFRKEKMLDKLSILYGLSLAKPALPLTATGTT